MNIELKVEKLITHTSYARAHQKDIRLVSNQSVHGK